MNAYSNSNTNKSLESFELNFKDFKDNKEIQINQIKLSLEKLENLQRISLRKKISFQKEELNNAKIEKNLEGNLFTLQEDNKELKINIENQKENIKILNKKNIEIKNQATLLNGKITELESENSKNFIQVKY